MNFNICLSNLTLPTLFFFFLNDPAPPEIYPLPLHDAFPIWARPRASDDAVVRAGRRPGAGNGDRRALGAVVRPGGVRPPADRRGRGVPRPRRRAAGAEIGRAHV